MNFCQKKELLRANNLGYFTTHCTADNAREACIMPTCELSMLDYFHIKV